MCPPAPYLSALAPLARKSSRFFIGAQNIFWEKEGAYTGEVSASMVKNLGGEYVIVGHSERRKLGETDEMVNRKVVSALSSGLTPVLCVGEAVRDGQGLFYEELKEQIRKGLARVAKKTLKNVVVAYEPVWAIGAKEAMTPRALQETYIFIRKVLSDLYDRDSADKVPVLYGGSVAPENAGNLVLAGGVQGLLVGRESRDPEAFAEILKIIDSI